MAREHSRTLDHAMRLLACFSREEPVLTASELARRLRISRTAVFRLLATFEHHGFIERSSDSRGYRIAIRAFEVGALYLDGHPGWELLLKGLDELVARTGYTAYLGALDGADTIILAYREGTLPVRFIWPVGSRLPSTTTAIGKAILARLPDTEIDARLGRGRLRGLTESSLQTRAQLDVELEQIRAHEWALTRNESYIGLTAVGAAVVDRHGLPVAGISLSLLDHPPETDRVLRAAEAVCETARRLSRHVAGQGAYGVPVLPEAPGRADPVPAAQPGRVSRRSPSK